MPDFSELGEEAKKFAGEHPDQVDQGLDKAEQFAEEKTGGRFGSQMQKGEHAAENYLGTGQDQDQNQ